MARAFCRPHAYTFNEQSKMATALTPQTDVTLLKLPRLSFFISLNLKLVTYLSIISMVTLQT